MPIPERVAKALPYNCSVEAVELCVCLSKSWWRIHKKGIVLQLFRLSRVECIIFVGSGHCHGFIKKRFQQISY